LWAVPAPMGTKKENTKWKEKVKNRRENLSKGKGKNGKEEEGKVQKKNWASIRKERFFALFLQNLLRVGPLSPCHALASLKPTYCHSLRQTQRSGPFLSSIEIFFVIVPNCLFGILQTSNSQISEHTVYALKRNITCTNTGGMWERHFVNDNVRYLTAPRYPWDWLTGLNQNHCDCTQLTAAQGIEPSITSYTLCNSLANSKLFSFLARSEEVLARCFILKIDKNKII